jgi:3-methyladenine DNA glycosylase AlkD
MEVKSEVERKNPIHKALNLLLRHLAVQQPEVAKDANKISAELDDLISQNEARPAATDPEAEKKGN